MESLPKHRRAVIDGEITYSDSSERVHLMKIVIKIQGRMRRKGRLTHKKHNLGSAFGLANGLVRKLKVAVGMNPEKAV